MNARIGLTAGLGCLTLMSSLAAQTFMEYATPTPGSIPRGIAAGPDGNLWFTESSSSANQIGRITPAGVITEFSVPTLGAQPRAISAGPDGNLWFTEPTQVLPLQPFIGRITPAGVVTEFPIPTISTFVFGITAGPDGNLWFTEPDNIGRITPAGVITEFPIPGEVVPFGIVAGPDGNLWFTEPDNIGRITTAGVITEFPIPTAGSAPLGIAAGPDGGLWFTESGAASIGRITTGPCVPNDTTLCLSASRFMVKADFETRDGRNGTAHAVAMTPNSGYFWFFDPTNVEVVTKVLPFCADPFNSIWIFASGLTNVKVELKYTDTLNGTVVTKTNGLGVPFAPIQDTSAFHTCP